MGGGGMGHLAYYAAWEHVYHLCGGVNWLAQFAISHWAFGPSAILERVTERAGQGDPARAHVGRDDDVLRHVGARRRLGRHHAAHPGGTRRRRLAAERPQDLDHPRADRRLDDRARHHRSRAGASAAEAGSARSSCRPRARLPDRTHHRHVGRAGRPGGGVGARGRPGRAVATGRRPARGLPDRPPGRLARARLQRGARRRSEPMGHREAVEYTKSRQAFGKAIPSTRASRSRWLPRPPRSTPPT